MDQKILWAVNKMPKTDDKLSTRAFLSTAKHH